MIAAMSMFGVLAGEIHGARERALEIVQIRVTTDAIPGSVTTTPIAPERLRTMALRNEAFPHHEGGAIADPKAQAVWREIVMHPDDWTNLLVEKDDTGRYLVGGALGLDPNRIMGIPVRHD